MFKASISGVKHLSADKVWLPGIMHCLEYCVEKGLFAYCYYITINISGPTVDLTYLRMYAWSVC